MFETFSFKHIPFPNFYTNVENFFLKMFRRLDPETRLSPDMPDDHDTESPDSSSPIDDSQLSAKLPSNLHMTTKTTNIGEQLLKRKLDHITHENCSAEDHTKQPQQKLAQLEVFTAPAATPFVSFFSNSTKNLLSFGSRDLLKDTAKFHFAARYGVPRFPEKLKIILYKNTNYSKSGTLMNLDSQHNHDV